MVRELGLERREAVWSLSTTAENVEDFLILVREDRIGTVNDVSVMKTSSYEPSSGMVIV